MTIVGEDGLVEFRFYRPLARDVRLAGDFTAWALHALPMDCVGDGWWSAQLRMDAGEYRFRYVADGDWFTDFASHGIEVCRQGWNSVLLIAESMLMNRDDPEKAVANPKKIIGEGQAAEARTRQNTRALSAA